MNLSAAIACVFTATVCVPLFLSLMRRIPVFEHHASSDKSFAELAREYRKYELRVFPVTMLLLALIAAPIWVWLESSYSAYLQTRPEARFVLAIPAFIWLLPAGFVALFLSALPVRYLLSRTLGRERYAEFVEYNDRKWRIDSWRLYRYLGAVLLPLCLLFTLLAFDSYTRIDDDGIVVNDFFDLGEKRYRFDEVEAIYHIRSGAQPSSDVNLPPHYVVRFRDGLDLDFYRAPQNLHLGQQQAVIEYLQSVTDLDLQSVDAESA